MKILLYKYILLLYIYIIYIYIKLQTVLFRPSGPHQCSADAEMKVKLQYIYIYERNVKCSVLKSNEDMIVALAGQFKQLSHAPGKFR